jgi:hypothetical protein
MAGHADATPQHTTRNEEDEDEWQRRLKEVGRVEKKEMESLEKRYKEGDRDGVEEGLKKLFEDDTREHKRFESLAAGLGGSFDG